MKDKYGTEIHQGDLLAWAVVNTDDVDIRLVMCSKEPVPSDKCVQVVSLEGVRAVPLGEETTFLDEAPFVTSIRRPDRCVVVRPGTSDKDSLEVMEKVLDDIYEYLDGK